MKILKRIKVNNLTELTDLICRLKCDGYYIASENEYKSLSINRDNTITVSMTAKICMKHDRYTCEYLIDCKIVK